MDKVIDDRLRDELTLDRGKIKDLTDESLDTRIRTLTEVVDGYDDPADQEGFAAAIAYIGSHSIDNYRAVLRILRKEKRRRRLGRPGGFIPKVAPWTPFVRLAPPNAADFDSEVAWARYRALAANDPNRTAEDYRDVYMSMLNDEHYDNSRYRVILRRSAIDIGFGLTQLVHLSVKRVDQQPLHDWRDLQRIKSELVGPEMEAIELYPAESRVVDTANQYHLWCIADPEFRFPFGFNEGRHVLGAEHANVGIAGAGQREFEA